MSAPAPVMVALELPEAEAYALAELCKRIGWTDARPLAVSEQECRAMMNASVRLLQALAARGVVVR